MATSDQVKRLIQTHYSGDEEAFRTCVLQIAAYEAKRGHTALAAEVKALLSTDGAQKARIISLANQEGLFEVSIPDVSLRNLVVPERIRVKLEKLIVEYRNKAKLFNLGFSIRRKVLLEGEPGTGKTMTASVLASELGLPLYVVQVDKLITKYMGETSTRLRQIFNVIDGSAGVFLFDEFDAIGADRSLDNDVGEMRRILNSFLQFIESDESTNIIIAATNNVKLLDPALFRRFDVVLHYERPTVDEAMQIVKQTFGEYYENLEIGDDTFAHFSTLCQADIVRVCIEAMKDHVLYETPITNEFLQALVVDRGMNCFEQAG